MSSQGCVEKICLELHPQNPIDIECFLAHLSSDGGLLPVREIDERIELTKHFAQAMDEVRGLRRDIRCSRWCDSLSQESWLGAKTKTTSTRCEPIRSFS